MELFIVKQLMRAAVDSWGGQWQWWGGARGRGAAGSGASTNVTLGGSGGLQWAHSVIWKWGCLWGLTVGSSGGGAGSGGSQWELTLKRTNPIMPTTTTSPAAAEV